MTQMTKGGNLPLTASLVRVTLFWTGGDGVPGVDSSALLLQADGRVSSDADFVFYNQPQHVSGTVTHAGSQQGPVSYDVIDVDLVGLPRTVQRIVLAASCDGGTFGAVPGLRLAVSDLTSGAELASFPMTADTETAFVTGELYRRDGDWKFRAVGQGYATGLAGLATDFGIDVGGDDTALDHDDPADASLEQLLSEPTPEPTVTLPPPSFTTPSVPLEPLVPLPAAAEAPELPPAPEPWPAAAPETPLPPAAAPPPPDLPPPAPSAPEQPAVPDLPPSAPPAPTATEVAPPPWPAAPTPPPPPPSAPAAPPSDMWSAPAPPPPALAVGAPPAPSPEVWSAPPAPPPAPPASAPPPPVAVPAAPLPPAAQAWNAPTLSATPIPQGQAEGAVQTLDHGPIELVRHQRVDLVRQGTPLARVMLDLSWEPAPGRRSVDLDASVIAFDENGKKLEIVWYQHQKDFDGALQHTGDARGEGSVGATERLLVELNRLPAQVAALVFTISSFHGHTFTDLTHAVCVLREESGAPIVTYDLTDTQPSTAVLMTILRRTDAGVWQVRAIGEYHDCRTVKKLVDPAARQVGIR